MLVTMLTVLVIKTTTQESHLPAMLHGQLASYTGGKQTVL